MLMTVNEELKDIAITEYLEDKEKKAIKYINDNVRLAALIMAAIYLIVFAVLAFKFYFSGRFEDGMEIFSMGKAVSLVFLLPACLITWIVMRKRSSLDKKAAEEELRKTSYAIEGDCLVRSVEGDGRRTKSYDLGRIRNVSKEGFLVTFEYGSEEAEFLDFYEPSLYDSLKK